MAGEPNLNGEVILVVEDDFLLARDAARALRDAGAEILGPYPSESAARMSLADHTLTGAVIDINLGHGPVFDLARDLSQSNVPFVFVTGYDAEIIPPEFANIECLQKPVEAQHIVRAFAKKAAERAH